MSRKKSFYQISLPGGIKVDLKDRSITVPAKGHADFENAPTIKVGLFKD